MRFLSSCFVIAICLCVSAGAANATPPPGEHFDPTASQSLRTVTLPPFKPCVFRTRNGFQLPDPNCTPGAINPTVTLSDLQIPGLTSKLRDPYGTPSARVQTYSWYGMLPPSHNTGVDQACELDHLIPLGLGGSDSLENIWPECGPAGATLRNRAFRQKDLVENYLTAQVKAGKIDLKAAQRGIAEDWTQYLPIATKFAATRRVNSDGQ